MVEGFVNIPLSENIALRFVGFNDDDGGYIDSVSDSITFPVTAELQELMRCLLRITLMMQ